MAGYAYFRPTDGTVIDLGVEIILVDDPETNKPKPFSVRVILDPPPEQDPLPTVTLILPVGVDDSYLGISTTSELFELVLQGESIIGEPTLSHWYPGHPFWMTFVGIAHSWVFSA